MNATNAAAGLVVASYRGGSTYAPLYETFVILPLIAAMALACVLISLYLRRAARRATPVEDQWQALAVMGELCPHGWQAQINLNGGGDAPSGVEAPSSLQAPVGLQWKQFEQESGNVLVEREVWAPSIGEALQRMVEDRRTDIMLEQVEETTEKAQGARHGN